MSMYLRLASILGAAALAAACGGGHDVTPTIITGGGVADPGIDGETNVYAIESVSDEPISGATVIVGSVTGETDETGLFVATGVSGSQQITVMADGFVTQTWVGVNGANVTVPLDLEEEGTPDVPQATVTGTIDGFLDLAPPQGGAKIGLVTYSANMDDDDPANDLAQPGGGGGVPPNACINSQLGSMCDWSLVTRTGPQTLIAFIGDLDLQTQAVDIDGFAYATGIDVQDGVDQDGVDLTIADDNELVTPDLTFDDPPSGTTEVSALVRVNLGEDGRLQLPVAGGDFAVPVPVLSLFDGSDYDLIVIANDGTDDNQSIVFDHEVPTVDGYTASDFVALPTGIAVDDKVFSSEVHAESSAMIFDVLNADGETQWAIAFFDGTAEVTQPDEVNLPSGALVLRAQAFVVPDVDFEDFALEELVDSVTAISSAQVDFTN